MLGSCVKQRTGTAAAIASQPLFSDSCVTIISRVIPSRLRGRVGVLLAFMVCPLRGMFYCWIPTCAGMKKRILQGIAAYGVITNGHCAELIGAMHYALRPSSGQAYCPLDYKTNQMKNDSRCRAPSGSNCRNRMVPAPGAGGGYVHPRCALPRIRDRPTPDPAIVNGHTRARCGS